MLIFPQQCCSVLSCTNKAVGRPERGIIFKNIAFVFYHHLIKVHPEIAERALLVVRRHLEVLAGPLVILSLAADRLDPEEKEAMGKRLHELRDHWSPRAMPLVRAAAPPELIQADGNLGEGWYEVSYNEVCIKIKSASRLLFLLRFVVNCIFTDLSTRTPSCSWTCWGGRKSTSTSSFNHMTPGAILPSSTTSA